MPGTRKAFNNYLLNEYINRNPRWSKKIQDGTWLPKQGTSPALDEFRAPQELASELQDPL